MVIRARGARARTPSVRRRTHALRAAAALVLALASAPAWGSNYTLYLEPGYLYDVTRIVDSSAQESKTYRQALLQNYRLAVDLDLARNLVLSASGNFIDTSNWTSTNGIPLNFDQPTVVASGRLNYSTPVLTAGLQYDYNRQWGTLLDVSRASEVAGGYATWRPQELPLVELRLTRTHAYDVLLQSSDNVIWSGLAGLRYSVQGLDLRYYLNWIQNQDLISEVTSSALNNMAQANYGDSFFGNRLSIYANAIAQSRSLTVDASGSAATVLQQQFPIQGLTLVEVFPATPADDTLVPNAALIDGNLLATTGINIGFGPSNSGDRNPRDLGVGFADAVTPVNMVYLWVDKPLPVEVVAAFRNSITAWASSDNLRWTQVPLAGPVVFGAFNARFEIPIPETSARYLKVVTTPLPVGVTNDRVYQDILVTEMQVYRAVSSSSLPPRTTQYSVQANGTLKAGILRAPNLDYDFTINYNRLFQSGIRTYSFVNGLTLNARLSRTWTVTSRVARNDADAGNGHEGQWQWSASLIARPFSTLYGALSYSGQVNQFTDRAIDPPVPASTSLQSVTLFGRADLYEGVNLQATLSGSNGLDQNQRATNSGTANLSLGLVPNPWLNFTLGYTYTTSWLTGGFLPDASDRSSRLNATLVTTPLPALSASLTGTWLILGATPTFFGTVQVNYSPLQGDLQFTFAYTRNFDTATQVSTQFLSPGIRWTIRPGVYLNGTYTMTDTVSPVLETHSQQGLASLIILL